MKNKSLESLNSPLFLLPTETLLHVQGGLRETETRRMMMCDHGEFQDFDGYVSDTEASN